MLRFVVRSSMCVTRSFALLTVFFFKFKLYKCVYSRIWANSVMNCYVV